jgi:hypothetical protein
MAALIKHNNVFTYEKLERIDRPEGRVYRPIGSEEEGVSSVTTILSATKDMEALIAWKQRVGEEEAERIKTQAAHVGTAMHLSLECLIEDKPLPPAGDWLQIRGYEMGYRLANRFFGELTEYWGSEVSLLYPGQFAGTTDLVGVYRGHPAIVDFKQSLKPKRKQWITDYFHQLAAYALAHDMVHGTDINFGVILVAIQDGDVQEFTTTGAEFRQYKKEWLERVARFYAPKPNVVSNGNTF